MIVVLVLMPAGVCAAAARPAGQEAGDVRVEVTAGLGGFVAAGRPYPVMVVVSADRLVRGTVEVSLSAWPARVVVERSVEVAGGTTEHLAVLAPPALDTGPRQVTVRVVEDGEQTLLESAAVRTDIDTELVGLLPEVVAADRSRPESVPLAVEHVGVARLRPVEPELLDLGPLALEPLDQLVAMPAELAGLSAERTAAVTAWVERGGQLLLVDTASDGSADAVAGQPGLLDRLDSVLPAGWGEPEAGRPVRAGLGQVRVVDAGWMEALLPSPTRSSYEEALIADDLLGGSLVLPLVEQAGIELPSAGALGLLLAGYVVLAGPVVFVALRAPGRRQLAWVLVPAVALAATAVVAVSGDALRPGDGSALVTVYETGPGGTMATSWSLLTRSTGGDVTLGLPAGWAAGPLVDQLSMTTPPEVQVVSGGVGDSAGIARTDAPTGGYGLITAWGPVPAMDEALVVTARSEVDGQVVGTVRNQLDVPLEHAIALVNRVGLVELGTLAPGEEHPFTIDAATTFQWGGPQPEEQVWPAGPGDNLLGQQVVVGPDGAAEAVAVDDGLGAPNRGRDAAPPADAGSPVVPAAWAAVVSGTGWNYRPPGQVLVVGWSDDIDPPVRPRDGTSGLTRTRAAVVARGTVAPAGDRLTDAAVVRTLVRGPITESGRLAVADDGGADGLFAFHLPPATDDTSFDPDRLVLGLPPWYAAAEVWLPGGWMALDIPDAEGGEVPIPPAAVVEGTVFVRAAIEPSPPVGGRNFVLYEQEAVPQ